MKTFIHQLVFCLTLWSSSTAMAEVIVVTVKGMVCSFCAQGIKKTFAKVEGVKSIDVDLDKKIVKIFLEPRKDLSDEVVRTLITDAGYDVHTINREKDA